MKVEIISSEEFAERYSNHEVVVLVTEVDDPSCCAYISPSMADMILGFEDSLKVYRKDPASAVAKMKEILTIVKEHQAEVRIPVDVVNFKERIEMKEQAMFAGEDLESGDIITVGADGKVYKAKCITSDVEVEIRHLNIWDKIARICDAVIEKVRNMYIRSV